MEVLIYVLFIAVNMVPVGKRPHSEQTRDNVGEEAKRVKLDGPRDLLSLGA
jgi:hypothetical protein